MVSTMMSSVPSTLNLLDWASLLAYAALLVGISIYHSRRIKARDDYYLAGRSMSRWPIAMSMYVALFSTNTFVGVIGWVNRPNGTIWIGLQNIGIILAVPLVVALFPSVFFRLKLTTAYEYLERRFSYPVRSLAAVFFLSARIMWMSTMLYAGSLVVSQLVGWTAERGVVHGQLYTIVILAAMGAFLSLAGGMRAVIWTDVAQFFVLFGCVAVMIVLAVLRAGGVEGVVSTAIQSGKFTPPSFFSLSDDLSVVSGLALGFIGFLASAGTDQVLLQTYLTAKSVDEAKKSLWFNGLFLKPLSLLFPLLGVIIFVYFQSHPEHASQMRAPDDALSVFIGSVLPMGLRGLAVAALLSALLTSLASGMSALSACLQVDFVQRNMQGRLSDRASVLLGRSLTVAWCLVTVAAAVFILGLGKSNNIIQILNIVMYPFTGVLLGIFLLGLLTARANATGALLGAVAGFVVTLGMPRLVLGISSFYFGALGTLTTLILGYGASLLFAPPAAEKTKDLLTARPKSLAAQ